MSRVVLITGATSGIGKDTAKRLAAEGCRVVVSGRRKEAGQQVSSKHHDCYVPAQFAYRTWQVVDEIEAAGGHATFVESDISSEAAAKALVDRTVEIYGRIDGAINNAGISTDAAPFADLKTEEFEKMIEVNVLGVFWCMKYEVRSWSRLNLPTSVLGVKSYILDSWSTCYQPSQEALSTSLLWQDWMVYEHLQLMLLPSMQ